MLRLAIVALAAATHAWVDPAPWSDSSSPSSSSDEECQMDADCPVIDCVQATCMGCKCVYDSDNGRLPFEDCCLDSEECCSVAGFKEIGICDKDCKCQFVPTLSGQCTIDSDCDNIVTEELEACRAEQCCEIKCDRFWCETVEMDELDKDGDGVPCPDDCDDNNTNISTTLKCYPDADGDGFPDCDSCTNICVANGTTCPDGYLESPLVEHENDPAEDGYFKILGDETCEPDAALLTDVNGVRTSFCDCCDASGLFYPNSPVGDNGETYDQCGDAVFSCTPPDSSIPEEYVCCGPDVVFVNDGFGSLAPIINLSHCFVLETDRCGKSSKNETVEGECDVHEGWQAYMTCDEEDGSAMRKRSSHGNGHACPSGCGDESPICVPFPVPGPENWPDIGQCALYVNNGKYDTGTDDCYDDSDCCIRTSRNVPAM